jgi:hypothetical protein
MGCPLSCTKKNHYNNLGESRNIFLFHKKFLVITFDYIEKNIITFNLIITFDYDWKQKLLLLIT